MYYYMITLVIILASIDSQIEKNMNEKNMQNLEDKKEWLYCMNKQKAIKKNYGS